MKKQQKKRFFNLIEVTVAIAVVGIGIAGIMALLPPAIEANRSADYNNYTGDVVSTLASYIETRLRNSSNWANAVSTMIPSSRPAAASLANLQFSPADDDTSKEESARLWTSITGLNGIYSVTKGGVSYYGVKTSDEGVRANILVWQDTAVDLQYHTSTSASETITPARVRTVFELSYPAGVPYAQRIRKQFVYEFYQRQP